MPIARLPLVSPIESRQPTTQRDARMVNCLVEDDKVVKRPGLGLLASSPVLPTSTGQGLFSWNNYLIAANGNSIYTIAGGVSSNIGSIVGSQVPLTFTKTASHSYMAINDGNNIYTVTKAGMTVTMPLSGSTVLSATINNGGSGYVAVPSVTFSAPPAGTTALGHATIFNGVVSGIVMDNAGTGYTTAPTVTIGAPTGTFNAATGTASMTVLAMTSGSDGGCIGGVWQCGTVTVTNGGGPYITPPSVTITHPTLGDLGIRGYSVLTNNIVTSVVITSNAYGYNVNACINGSLALTVSFGPASGTTATATANMSNTISGPYTYGIEYMDGYVFVMTTTGRIYASDYENPTLWNALNYLTAESEPDSGVALVKHLNYLIAFGQYSTDFFYNAGNATGSPLAVNKQAKLEFGCAAGPSVAKADQTVLWVSNSKTEGRSVFMLNGLTPQKVSNRYIEKYLNRDLMQNVRSYCMKMAGHTLYVLTLKDSDITFVYDLDEKHWYQWTSQSGGVETYFKYVFFNGYVDYTPNLYLQHEGDGKVYIMGPDYYKDATEDIWFRVVTKNLDSGSNKRKFITKVEVIGDKVDGNLSLRHTENDYATWSTYRTVDLSKPRPVLYNNGSTRRRAYEVFSSDNIPIRLEALELEFGVGETGGGQEG